MGRAGRQALRGTIGLRDRPPDTRTASNWSRRLEDRLGRARRPPYRADLRDLETDERAGDHRHQDDITRFNLTGTVSYAVTETATGRAGPGGQVETFTGLFRHRLARRHHLGRAPRCRGPADGRLADQIVSRLIAGAGTWRHEALAARRAAYFARPDPDRAGLPDLRRRRDARGAETPAGHRRPDRPDGPRKRCA